MAIYEQYIRSSRRQIISGPVLIKELIQRFRDCDEAAKSSLFRLLRLRQAAIVNVFMCSSESFIVHNIPDYLISVGEADTGWVVTLKLSTYTSNENAKVSHSHTHLMHHTCHRQIAATNHLGDLRGLVPVRSRTTEQREGEFLPTRVNSSSEAEALPT
eukprot:768802-Hanusia_phi.AAC.13